MDGSTDVRTNERTDVRTDGRIDDKRLIGWPAGGCANGRTGKSEETSNETEIHTCRLKREQPLGEGSVRRYKSAGDIHCHCTVMIDLENESQTDAGQHPQ